MNRSSFSEPLQTFFKANAFGILLCIFRTHSNIGFDSLFSTAKREVIVKQSIGISSGVNDLFGLFFLPTVSDVSLSASAAEDKMTFDSWVHLLKSLI